MQGAKSYIIQGSWFVERGIPGPSSDCECRIADLRSTTLGRRPLRYRTGHMVV